MSPEQARQFEDRLGRLARCPAAARGGATFDNVVHLFASSPQREWTAPEVQAALAHGGRQVDPKSVHNVLSYLTRKGRLKRLGRGQYLIVDLGVGLQLSHDLDGIDPNDGGCSDE